MPADLNIIYLTGLKGADIVSKLKKISTLSSNYASLLKTVNGKQDIIEDLETIRSNAKKGSTALQSSAISDMLTKSVAKNTYQPKGDYAFKTDIPNVENKADKANTLGGYGITDAFTKEEIRLLFANFTPSEGGGSTPGTGFEPFDDTLIWEAINKKQDTIDDLQQIRDNASTAAKDVIDLSDRVTQLENNSSGGGSSDNPTIEDNNLVHYKRGMEIPDNVPTRNIGDLTDLHTKDKSSVVAAINEVVDKGGGNSTPTEPQPSIDTTNIPRFKRGLISDYTAESIILEKLNNTFTKDEIRALLIGSKFGTLNPNTVIQTNDGWQFPNNGNTSTLFGYDANGFDAVKISEHFRNSLFADRNKHIKFCCLGDSITSNQKTNTGARVNELLGTTFLQETIADGNEGQAGNMTTEFGNLAVGYATMTDHYVDGVTDTTINLHKSDNINVAKAPYNVLSNQVRRLLQHTTPQGEDITWTHPNGGTYTIDGATYGYGKGYVNDIPNIIYIAAGTNDVNEWQKVDNYSTVIGQSYSALKRDTLCSALRWAVETLQINYPLAKIFVCTPLITANRGYDAQITIADMIIKMCQWLGVQVIDQCRYSGISKTSAKQGWMTEDGLHPNANGKELSAQYIAGQIKSGCGILK